MKHCKECGRVLSIDEFYRHAAMKDGRLNKCKKCVRQRVSKHRGLNVDRIRAYDRRRSMTRERRRANATNAARYRKRFPDRYKAQTALNNAVRDERIVKLSRCSDCGATAKLHAHHEDYSKPLDVQWLCVPCHALMKGKNGSTA